MIYSIDLFILTFLIFRKVLINLSSLNNTSVIFSFFEYLIIFLSSYCIERNFEKNSLSYSVFN